MKKSNKVTEVKSSKKHEMTKLEKTIDFLDKNRKIIYSFIGGVLVTALVATIIWPDRIATLKDGTQPVAEIKGKKITADDVYAETETSEKLNLLLYLTDSSILTKMYEEDDEMKSELEKTANDYYKQAEQYYQMSQKDFLKQYGFTSHEEFIEELKINYLRNKYYDEYVENLITEDEINDYYEDKVYGDIDSKHMLVTIDEDRTEEDAKKLANEIITKLNEGKTFDEVKEEYKDSITYEELGYQPFNANIQESYMTALKNLANDKYTTEPVKTSYGYHIIYRINQKEKPSLEDVKDTIIESIAATKKSEDEKLNSKALIHLREENDFKFYDTVIEEKYKEYKKSVEE